MPSGAKTSYALPTAGLFKYLWPFVTTRHERVKYCSNMIFSALGIFLVVVLSKSLNRPVSSDWNPVVLLFGLDHTSSFEIIHTRIGGNRQFLWYCFYVWSQYWNAERTLKFCPSFKLFRSCPLLKVVHAYQNFLEQHTKAPSYRSMEQLGVPCVKRGEGLCYFGCNIFYFDQIKLRWNSR